MKQPFVEFIFGVVYWFIISVRDVGSL